MKTIRGLLVSLAAAVALLGWVLPRVTDTTWREMGEVLRTVPHTAMAGCLVLAMLFLISSAFTLRVSLPGVTIHKAIIVNTAGSAGAKFLPGGGAAATFLLCRSWGFSANAVTTSVIVTGVWNIITRAALPILAVGLLALTPPELPGALRQTAWAAGVLGVLILAVFLGVIGSARVAELLGRAVDGLLGQFLHRGRRSGRALAAMREIRAQILERVRESWHWLTLGMLGFFAAQLGIFLIALHVTGIELAFTAAFAAFAIGRLLTGVGITPGGIGITETGTAAVLVALGADPTRSAAAVVLVAIFTNLIELPFGVLALGLWSLDPRRQTRPGRTRPPGVRLPGSQAEVRRSFRLGLSLPQSGAPFSLMWSLSRRHGRALSACDRKDDALIARAKQGLKPVAWVGESLSDAHLGARRAASATRSSTDLGLGPEEEFQRC